MSGGYFITGTDTGVGKTVVGLGLMRALKERGRRVAAIKPVASGCRERDGVLCNDDALRLQAEGSVGLPYSTVNPYAFASPIAPHLAAAEAGVWISIARIVEEFRGVAAQVETVIVEGVGGWRVPLDERETVADLAAALGLPVILVVAVRLGCLNHALLTVEGIHHSGVALAGWVANRLEPACTRAEANIDTLRRRIPAPLLGILPRLARPDPAAGAAHLHPERLAAWVPSVFGCRPARGGATSRNS